MYYYIIRVEMGILLFFWGYLGPRLRVNPVICHPSSVIKKKIKQAEL